MTAEPDPVHRPRRRLPRVPPFCPVPLRPTHNAFSPRLQAHFLGYLAETGSVAQACARVGMSRQSAYRLRTKPGAESFVAAWEVALGRPKPRVTSPDLEYLAYHGYIRLRFRAGKYLGAWQKPDAAAHLKLLRRYDRVFGRIDRLG